MASVIYLNADPDMSPVLERIETTGREHPAAEDAHQ
jgi:hypothetical protein